MRAYAFGECSRHPICYCLDLLVGDRISGDDCSEEEGRNSHLHHYTKISAAVDPLVASQSHCCSQMTLNDPSGFVIFNDSFRILRTTAIGTNSPGSSSPKRTFAVDTIGVDRASQFSKNCIESTFAIPRLNKLIAEAKEVKRESDSHQLGGSFGNCCSVDGSIVIPEPYHPSSAAQSVFVFPNDVQYLGIESTDRDSWHASSVHQGVS
jgi:hypothetical protein